MNSASSQGPTDAFSSGAVLCGHSIALRAAPRLPAPPPAPAPRTEVLATFPRCVMFLLCFSLAMRMRCLATMVRPRRAGPGPLRSALCAASAPRGAARRKPSRRAPPAANPCRPPAALPGRQAEAASPRHVTGGASRAARRGAPRGGRAATHPEVEAPPRWRRPRRCWQVGAAPDGGAPRTAPGSALPPAEVESRRRRRRSVPVLPSRCGGGCGGRGVELGGTRAGVRPRARAHVVLPAAAEGWRQRSAVLRPPKWSPLSAERPGGARPRCAAVTRGRAAVTALRVTSAPASVRRSACVRPERSL